MSIIVGSYFFNKNTKKWEESKWPGYKPIKITVKDQLHPYNLRDKYGRIIHNVWEFNKIYQYVPQKTEYSDNKKTVSYEHNSEIHLNNNVLTDEYNNWRQKGLNYHTSVRYPVGNDRSSPKPIAYYDEKTNSYISDENEAFKKIFLDNYLEALKTNHEFNILKTRVNMGENILLLDFEGPRTEDEAYYNQKYGLPLGTIIQNIVGVNMDVLNIFLNDKYRKFAPSYAIAAAIYELDDKFTYNNSVVSQANQEEEEN